MGPRLPKSLISEVLWGQDFQNLEFRNCFGLLSIILQLCYYFHCVAPSQPHPRSVRLESSVHSRVEPNVAHVPKVNIQVRAQDNLILDVHAHLQINLDVQVILVHAHMKDAYAVKPAHLDTTVVF